MNKKTKKAFFIFSSLAILFSANLVFANPIVPESSFGIVHNIGFGPYFRLSTFIATSMLILLGLGSEILFGYLFFFRHHKRGVLSLVYANLLSYPIFYIFTTAIHVLSITQGEILVVILEAIFIKLYLNNEISIKKSVLVSIILNILSIVISLVLYIPIYIILDSFFKPTF